MIRNVWFVREISDMGRVKRANICAIKRIIPENQPEDRHTRRPELPLTLLEMAYSYAALDSRTTVSRKDFSRSVRHTNLLKKEIRTQAESFFDTK